jgi:anti-sigma regulatory factor (Ser/Thr protein kinase)
LVEQECSGDVVEFGTLILHELCANAIAVNETSAAGIVVVHVESGIYISVTDRAGGVEMITLLMQTRQNMSSALAERGRGLPMIGAICENLKATRADGEVVCGTYGVEELADGGKNVWAWLPKEAELSASA